MHLISLYLKGKVQTGEVLLGHEEKTVLLWSLRGVQGACGTWT